MRFPVCYLLFAVLVASAPATFASPLPGFAVVELFTSEGCSSCPPADEALSRISRAAAAEKAPLYILEWHVDYWDYLGWKDPFGSPAASTRQGDYARALGSSLYTPQAILNGYLVTSWAGDEGEVEADARQLMSGQTSSSSTLTVTASVSGASVHVHVVASGAPGQSAVVVALVQEGLSSKPTRGENAGRMLSHSAVVRNALTLPAAGGDIVLHVPSGVDFSRSRVVAFLQDSFTMRIALAASSAILAAGRMSGQVVDPAGRGVEAVLVKVCSGLVCIPAATDRYGHFTVDNLPAGSYTVSLDDAAPIGRFTVAPGQSLALGQIRRSAGPLS